MAEDSRSMGSKVQVTWLLSIAWRRKWVPLIALAVVAPICWWTYRRSPKVYTATFHVQYESSPLSGRLAPLAEALGLSDHQDLQTQMFIVQSHEVAKVAVEKLPFAKDAGDAEKYALAQKVIGSTSAQRLGASFIFEVQVQWDDPQACVEVAKAVLQAYEEYDRTSRTEKEGKTRELLEQYAVKLRDDTASARAQMAEAGRLDEIDKEIESLRAEGAKVQQELADQVQKWTEEREEASLTYRDTWPGLREITDRIEGLRKIGAALTAPQLDAAVHALSPPGETGPPGALAASLQPFVVKQRRRVETENSIRESQARREKLAASLQEKTGSALTQRELTRLIEQYEQLQANIQTEMRTMDLDILKVSNRFTVLKEPTLPEAPASPNAGQFIYPGLAAVLFLSVVALYFLESLDPSMRTVEDIEHYTNVDVVAVIPTLAREKAATEGVGVLAFDPKERHGAADAYRICRVNLLALLDQAPPGKARILITSSEPQEGKSTTVSNLACAFAESGAKTLLVSCNLRRPTMEKVFGIRHEPGVVDVLSGTTPWTETVVQAIFPSLHLLPTGKIGPDSFVLLNSPRLEAFLEAISEEYDIVLVDSPPSLLASDALILAPRMDGVVVVYSVRETSKRSLLRTVDLLSKSKGKLLGIVANHKTFGAQGAYYAYYHYAPETAGSKGA